MTRVLRTELSAGAVARALAGDTALVYDGVDWTLVPVHVDLDRLEQLDHAPARRQTAHDVEVHHAGRTVVDMSCSCGWAERRHVRRGSQPPTRRQAYDAHALAIALAS